MRPRRHGRGFAFAWSAEWAIPIMLASLAGCRSPTQIEVNVSTNVQCPQVSGTSITTGTLGEIEAIPPTSTTANCAGGYIGALVLIPSGGDENALVGFKVVTAINGATVDQCSPDDAGGYGADCIVARRALRYLPHTPLQVNVLMSGACAGKGCDPTSTCVEGECVPATIGDPTACEGSGCNETQLEPDGGIPEPGDATIQDAASDGATDATLAQDAPSDATSDGPFDGPVSPVDSGFPGAVPGCDMGGALAGAAWPMEDYCPSHRNRSPFLGPSAKPTMRWTRNFGPSGSMLAAPSIGPDGTLYVGAGAAVYALEPSHGQTVWEYVPDGGGGFLTMPLLASDGTVCAVDLLGKSFAALAIDGGAPKLVAPLALPGQPGYGVRGGLTIAGDGTLYASDNESHLLSFDSTGTVAWAVAGVADDYIYPTVASDGTLLTATDVVYASYPDGGTRWAADAGTSQQLSTVAIAPDGTLRVSSPLDGTLSAYQADGGFLWQVSIGSGGNPAQIAVADDGTTYMGASNALAAWDSTGKPAGNYPGACSQPVIDAAGNVYAECDGALLELDPGLANVIWTFPLTQLDPYQLINDSPVIGPGNTIYMSFDTENEDGGPPEVVMGFGP